MRKLNLFIIFFFLHVGISKSQTIEDAIHGQIWSLSHTFDPSVLTTIGSIQSMQFMEDGNISFPDIDNLDKDQKLTYELSDSILYITIGDITTSFGKIRTINDHFMVLNPVVEESGEVIRSMNLRFYSHAPSELNLHPEVLKDLQAYSKWLIQAYGQSIELTVGPGGKEYDHSSILQDGDQYFLLIDQKKFKIISIYHDKMKVLGIGRDGYSEIQLIKD